MPRRLSLLAATLAACLALSACGHDGTSSAGQPTLAPPARGALGPGFWDPSDPPAPEATIVPTPGSWDAVHPSADYQVALVVDRASTDSAAQTAVLRTAVRGWADSVHVQLTEYDATADTQYVARLQAAIDADPDLVISVGNGLADPLAMVSAPNLETQFLMVGAQIAEPTANVTAADWIGAMYRGEGLGLPEAYDPATFTEERAGRAVRAGVAAVLSGLTGIVVQVS